MENKINYCISELSKLKREIKTISKINNEIDEANINIQELLEWSDLLKSVGYTKENILLNQTLLKQTLILNAIRTNLVEDLQNVKNKTLPLGFFNLTVGKLNEIMQLNERLDLTLNQKQFSWYDVEQIGVILNLDNETNIIDFGGLTIHINYIEDIQQYEIVIDELNVGSVPPLKIIDKLYRKTNLYIIYYQQQAVVKLYQFYINPETYKIETEQVGEIEYGINISNGTSDLDVIISYVVDGDLELLEYYKMIESRIITKLTEELSLGLVTDKEQNQLQAANSVSGVMAMAQIAKLQERTPLLNEVTYVFNQTTLEILHFENVEIDLIDLNQAQIATLLSLYKGVRLYDLLNIHGNRRDGIGLFNTRDNVLINDFSTINSVFGNSILEYNDIQKKLIVKLQATGENKLKVKVIKQDEEEVELNGKIKVEILNPKLIPKHRITSNGKSWTYGYRTNPNIVGSTESYYDSISQDETNFRPMLPSTSIEDCSVLNYNYGINGQLRITFEIPNQYITSGTSFVYESPISVNVGDQIIIIPSLSFQFTSIIENDVSTYGYIAEYITGTEYIVNLTEQFIPASIISKEREVNVYGGFLESTTIQGKVIIPSFGGRTKPLRFYIPQKYASAIFNWTNRVFQVEDVSTYYVQSGTDRPSIPLIILGAGDTTVKSTMVYSQTIENESDFMTDETYYHGLVKPSTSDVNGSSNSAIRISTYTSRALTFVNDGKIHVTPPELTRMIEDDIIRTVKNEWTNQEMFEKYNAINVNGGYRSVNYNPTVFDYDEEIILDTWQLTITSKNLTSNTAVNLNNVQITNVPELWLPVGVTNLSNISEYLSRFSTMLEALREFQVDITDKVVILTERIKYVEQVMTNLITVVNQLSDAVNQLLQTNSGNVGVQILNFIGSSVGNFLPVVGTIITILGGVLEGVSQIHDGDWATGMMAITSGVLLGAYVGHKYHQKVQKKLFQEDLKTISTWNIDSKLKNDLLKIHGTKVTTTPGNVKTVEPQSSSHYVRFNDDNGSVISLDLNDVMPMSIGMNDVRRDSNASLLSFMNQLESQFPLMPHEISFKNQILYDMNITGTRRGRGRILEQNWNMELIGIFNDDIASITNDKTLIMEICNISKVEQFTLLMVYLGICGTQATTVIPVDTVYQIGNSFSKRTDLNPITPIQWQPFIHTNNNIPFTNTKESLNFNDTVLYKLSKSNPDYLESLIQ